MIAVADNTFASPFVQRPLELGFDIVVHSTTKYLNGHSDVIGGVAIVGGDDRQAEWRERLAFLQNAVGAIAGPFDSFLALRGVKTLALRMERHNRNALALAQWLESQPEVARVRYPGLRIAPAARTGEAPDARLRRHGVARPEDRPRGHAALPRSGEDLLARRKPGRRREPDRAPGDHDARHHPAGDARDAGHRRRAGAAVGGHRGRGRSAGGSDKGIGDDLIAHSRCAATIGRMPNAPTIHVACLCAAWCRLCDDYRAVLESLADEFDRAGVPVHWHWVDIEDEADLVGDLDVETFPTIVVADDAHVRFAGRW